MSDTLNLLQLILGVGVLGIGGGLIKYMIRIEKRLTKIEVKMGIDDES